MNDQSKVALVTGASRGIGLAIAQELAAAGWQLAVNATRPQEQAQEALESLRSRGGQVLYCRGDVSSPADRQAMLDAVQSRFGRLDALVNNAGVAPQVRTDILEATEESFERLIRINLQGPYFLTQAAAKWMVRQKDSDAGFAGAIVNISSVSAQIASVSRGEYCISKAGVSMATQLWAMRLAQFGINVYEVRPGIVATDMTAAVKGQYDKLIAEGLVPQGRWGSVADVGKAVAMLLRGDLAYSTGQVLTVDGGLGIHRL